MTKCLWKHFECLKIETKKKEKNKNMYKSKKVPLQEGPNDFYCLFDAECWNKTRQEELD